MITRAWRTQWAERRCFEWTAEGDAFRVLAEERRYRLLACFLHLSLGEVFSHCVEGIHGGCGMAFTVAALLLPSGGHAGPICQLTTPLLFFSVVSSRLIIDTTAGLLRAGHMARTMLRAGSERGSCVGRTGLPDGWMSIHRGYTYF